MDVRFDVGGVSSMEGGSMDVGSVRFDVGWVSSMEGGSGDVGVEDTRPACIHTHIILCENPTYIFPTFHPQRYQFIHDRNLQWSY